MKKFLLQFLHRGMIGCGIGPIVLAVLYFILNRHGVLLNISINQVCIGIFSLAALAFIAGGLNVLYQIERLPLMVSILIHGGVLYAAYLITYLVNGWLDFGFITILVFSAIFIVGYLVIWGIIYSFIRKSTNKINEKLKQKQKYQTEE